MLKISKHPLVKNTLAYISGDVVQKAFNFILVPIWVRFLTPDEYGIFGTLVAYTGMVTSILSMGLHAAIVRNYYDYVEDKDSQKSYVTTIMYFLVGVVGLVVLALNQWGELLWEAVTAGQIAFDPFVRLTLLTILANIINQTIASVFQAEQKARQFLVIQYARFIAVVTLTFILVIVQRQGALGMIAGQAIGSVVVSVIALVIFGREWFVPRFRWDYVRSGLNYGLPLVPHTASLWILQSSDRIILEYFVTLTELGIYNLGYTLGLVLTFLIQGVNRGWAPYFYRLVSTENDPNDKIMRFALIYFLGVSAIGLFGIMFANELIHLLLPDTYYDSARIVGPVLFGSFMSALYLFVSKPIWYLKKTKVAPRISISSAIVNILLNLWWIPIFGSIAAAWSTVVAYSIMFVWYLWLSQKFFPLPYQFRLYGLLIGMIFVVTIAIQIIGFDSISMLYILAKSLIFVGYIALGYWILQKENALEDLISA